MNPITQLIKDLEALRHGITRDDNAQAFALCNAYLCANREALRYYVNQFYQLPTAERTRLAISPAIDGSVFSPDFKEVALHAVQQAETAWLQMNRPDEDSLHMLTRALRAAEISVKPIESCTLFLSPINAYLPR